MDEFSEAITLIQTQRMEPFPVILYGKDYWTGLLDWMKGPMLAEGCVAEKELDIIQMVNKPEDVIKIIKNFYAKKRR